MTHLSTQDFLPVWKEKTGLIPVSIDIKKRTIGWADIGKYHFYEGFFAKSLDQFYALQKEFYQCESSVEILNNDIFQEEAIEPTAFIFHGGRSGSTLLAKVLARSENNLMIGESEPHNDILHILSKDGNIKADQLNQKIYRNLIFAMGRKRSDKLQNHIVKFSSYNVVFFDFIHGAFPLVPSIFITRNFQEIISSVNKKMPGWYAPNSEILNLINHNKKLSTITQIVEHFLDLAKSNSSLHKFDYSELKKENLSQILQLLKIEVSNKDLALMEQQFDYYSKANFNSIKFDPLN